MAREGLTLDYEQLLQDLATASRAEGEVEREPGVFTRPEIDQIWGTNQSTTYRRLRELCEQGLLERTWTTRLDGWDGPRRVKAYRVVLEESEESSV